MSMKRKRTAVTIEQKSEILRRLDRGEKASKIAQEYNIGKTTVSDIKKARPAIEKFINQSDTSYALQRKSMKPAKDERLDEAVFWWFTQQRDKGVVVSGQMLQEKASILHEIIHNDDSDHKVSSGWLQRFKDRHGIRQLSNCAEQKPVDYSTVNQFRQKLQSIFREEQAVPSQPPADVSQAIEGLRVFIEWYERQDDVDAINLMNLSQLLAVAKTKKQKQFKQQRLDDFFKRCT